MCQKNLYTPEQIKSHSKLHGLECQVNLVEADSSHSEILSEVDQNLKFLNASLPDEMLINSVAIKRDLEGDLQPQVEKKEYTNKCNFCPKTFRKPSDLIRHTRTHTGERPYRCEFCNKSFAVKCTLDGHMKIHSGQKTFACNVCNSMFATKGSLKVHMRLHTGKGSKQQQKSIHCLNYLFQIFFSCVRFQAIQVSNLRCEVQDVWTSQNAHDETHERVKGRGQT